MRQHHREFLYKPLGKMLRRQFPEPQLWLFARIAVAILLAYCLL